MRYSKKEIGEALKKELDKGYNVERIANWADDLFFSMRDEQNFEIKNILRQLFLMDAGPEFEYSEKELRILIDLLINEEIDPIGKIENKQRQID